MEQISYKQYLKHITTFVFDIDGVMTTGQVLVSDEGHLLRSMNVRDGFAIKQAIAQGYNICIITGGNNKGARIRFEELGVTDIYMNNNYKMEPLMHYLTTKGIDPKNVLYMGDDVPDVAPMKAVGMPTCPSDATAEAKEVAKYISSLAGGLGCVRDVIEQVMKVQGKWKQEMVR